MMEQKWYFICFAVIMVGIVGSEAYSSSHKNAAKRDVLVACYQSGAKDCQQQVNNEFKGD